MRRWDSLTDAYIEEYEARGISPATIEHAHRELLRCSSWMKRRRPKPRLEDIGPELLVHYIKDRTPFKSKATIYSLMSRMRCFGDFLVREGVWIDNPLKWMHGPKVTPYHRMPKRIGATDMKLLLASSRIGRPDNLPQAPRDHAAVIAVRHRTAARRVAATGCVGLEPRRRHPADRRTQDRQRALRAGTEHRLSLHRDVPSTPPQPARGTRADRPTSAVR